MREFVVFFVGVDLRQHEREIISARRNAQCACEHVNGCMEIGSSHEVDEGQETVRLRKVWSQLDSLFQFFAYLRRGPRSKSRHQRCLTHSFAAEGVSIVVMD